MTADTHPAEGRVTEANRFRKKPVVIEAVQWDGDQPTFDLIERWAGKPVMDTDGYTLLIPTLEGTMEASLNDWIIRGVKGEIYPCKPDIFAATYEPSLTPPQTEPGVQEAAIELLSHLKLHVMEKLGSDDADALHDRMLNLTAALSATPATEARVDVRPTGHVSIAHDGFTGDIIGHYITREGKRGVVVQQDGTRVVHVYGEKWLGAALESAPAEPGREADVRVKARDLGTDFFKMTPREVHAALAEEKQDG